MTIDAQTAADMAVAAITADIKSRTGVGVESEATRTWRELVLRAIQAAQVESEEARKVRAFVVSVADARKEFVMVDDGYVHWWPSLKPEMHGALAPYELRILADECDRRNARWHAQVCEGLGEMSQREKEG